MRVYVFIAVLFYIYPACADEMALIDHLPPPKAINKTVSEIKTSVPAKDGALKDEPYGNDDSFIEDEGKKIREIKLLSLDVEKTGLELKRQQMMVRMGKANNRLLAIPRESGDKKIPLIITVQSVLISPSNKLAIITIDNTRYTVNDQQTLPGGLLIKSITADKVQVQHPDGYIEDVFYTKG